MEITGEGLTRGAGTVLAKMARDGRGAPRVALDDGPRAMALLATAYERPVAAHVLGKMRRACDLWNAGEKALAHIHLAYANLAPCDNDLALRLFVADELFEAGVAPATLMKEQGSRPAPRDLLKANFNPDQPRVPADSGYESGEWSGGEANFTQVAFLPRRGRGHRGGRSWFDAIRGFLESLGEWRKEGEPPREPEPPHEEDAKPENAAPNASLPELEIAPRKPSDFVGQDFGKLGVGVEKPELDLDGFRRHGSIRSEGRGVSVEEMQNTVSDPLIVLKQSQGQYLYLSDNAVVVLNPSGEVITTYPASKFDATIKEILDFVHRGSKR
ncbi:MAG: hypothetical protein ACREDM_06065 [Methylocella sp.]